MSDSNDTPTAPHWCDDKPWIVVECWGGGAIQPFQTRDAAWDYVRAQDADGLLTLYPRSPYRVLSASEVRKIEDAGALITDDFGESEKAAAEDRVIEIGEQAVARYLTANNITEAEYHNQSNTWYAKLFDADGNSIPDQPGGLIWVFEHANGDKDDRLTVQVLFGNLARGMNVDVHIAIGDDTLHDGCCWLNFANGGLDDRAGYIPPIGEWEVDIHDHPIVAKSGDYPIPVEAISTMRGERIKVES